MDKQQQTSSKKKSVVVPTVLVVVWACIIVLFGYSLWSGRNSTTADETNDTNAAISTPEGTNTPTLGTPPQQMSETEREQARMRDTKRLSDIKMIQVALESYKKASAAYPESLSQLVPTYLKDLPTNPSPGGMEYSYTAIGGTPYTYYDLNYYLEIGADDIALGDHTASPGGVATP